MYKNRCLKNGVIEQLKWNITLNTLLKVVCNKKDKRKTQDVNYILPFFVMIYLWVLFIAVLVEDQI